ncbi:MULTISPECIES: FAD-binding domain-containing protein [unclassified Rathayibacter]|uniref:FAD-binding domain-containing protein n=1 Tax=unclassified Rathayibacter TaxID=2609250 RepID=UPI0010451B03|nr:MULTISPECIES: FAD-binding domain-containing protein [unclassified Rathayibacter]TCL86075.1 DNA photolyase-like FAD binding protein [Rathayibacter sp. PhB192]TCM31896.1 DNA photolyase-like FAD binding protein [Rathayibacter sp. PhB179]
MFIPTRAAGLEALDDFVARAGSAYTRERNHDHGPSRSNVSGLSPYLRHRLVTEREVVAAVLARHTLTAAEKFVQEVFWRTYWKGWLEQNPEVWRRYRREVSDFEGHLPTGYADAIEGRSGIDAMDAWVQELVETGYLHNHTRMWFASIWIFTLGLPWQLGADFFYRHLLDGDAASNTLSWRWVAGLQTPGKTYLATASNIAKYTEGRFSPQGLATSAPALSEEHFPPRTPIEPDDVVGTLGTRPGLLLHEEDLDAGSLLAEQPGLAERLIATAAVADPGERSPFAVSEAVQDFTAAAIADAAERTPDKGGRPARVLADALPATVVGWAASERLDTVVVPYAPVGPVQERLDALRSALAQEGIALVTVRRRWDGTAWPSAVRGFFAFKKRIPTLVRGLDEPEDAVRLF